MSGNAQDISQFKFFVANEEQVFNFDRIITMPKLLQRVVARNVPSTLIEALKSDWGLSPTEKFFEGGHRICTKVAYQFVVLRRDELV